jgi:phospholipid/cholesterol/gamma-HCH transport system permease protein
MAASPTSVSAIPLRRRRRVSAPLVALGRMSLSILAVYSLALGLLLTTFWMLIAGAADGRSISLSAVFRRIADIGFYAILITALFGMSIGAVFGILLGSLLQLVNLLDIAIGQAAIILVEQIAPLFVGIMVAARSGAALAADLSSMIAAHEVDALRSIGLSPERMLIAPTLLAALFAVPLLNIFMITFVLLTLALYLNLTLAIPPLLVLTIALNAIEPASLFTALGKGLLFGALIMAVAAAQGLSSPPATRAVGHSVTDALVRMITTILIGNALWTLVF